MKTFRALGSLLVFTLSSTAFAGPPATQLNNPTAGNSTWVEKGALGEHDDITFPLDLSGAVPCEARRDPSPWLLLGVGAALAPLAYETGVMWHEGSHAAFVTAFHGHVTGVNPWPSVQNGQLFFGDTTYTGQFTNTQAALISIAPKFTDAAILTGYTFTNELGLMPENKWAQLGIDALAVAALVDLGHDTLQTYKYGDIPDFYRDAGITNDAPYRFIQAGLTGLAAIEVGRGLWKLFSPVKNQPVKKDKSEPEKTASDFTIRPYIGTESGGVEGTF